MPDDRRFAALTAGWGASGHVRVDGMQGAYRRVDEDADSANHWYVVALPATQRSTLSGIGAIPGVLVAVALLMLTYATIGLRRRQMPLAQAARTDALTGLRNRRALNDDRQAAAARARADRPLVLALFDLNGFGTRRAAKRRGKNDRLSDRPGKPLFFRTPPGRDPGRWADGESGAAEGWMGGATDAAGRAVEPVRSRCR